MTEASGPHEYLVYTNLLLLTSFPLCKLFNQLRSKYVLLLHCSAAIGTTGTTTCFSADAFCSHFQQEQDVICTYLYILQSVMQFSQAQKSYMKILAIQGYSVELITVSTMSLFFSEMINGTHSTTCFFFTSTVFWQKEKQTLFFPFKIAPLGIFIRCNITSKRLHLG